MAIQDGFSPSYWKRERALIGASSVLQTRNIPESSYRSGKYILALWNDLENKSKTMEINAVNENGAISDTVRAILGSQLNVDVEVKTSGGNIYLEVDNQESYDLNMVVIYLAMG